MSFLVIVSFQLSPPIANCINIIPFVCRVASVIRMIERGCKHSHYRTMCISQQLQALAVLG